MLTFSPMRKDGTSEDINEKDGKIMGLAILG